MSELKSYKMVDEDYCDNALCVVPSDVYLKSEADKVIRHNKYKRCLAMTKWCNYWANYWECCEPPDCSLFITKAKYYRKWLDRWLKIAEQFKED